MRERLGVYKIGGFCWVAVVWRIPILNLDILHSLTWSLDVEWWSGVPSRPVPSRPFLCSHFTPLPSFPLSSIYFPFQKPTTLASFFSDGSLSVFPHFPSFSSAFFFNLNLVSAVGLGSNDGDGI